MSTKNRLLQIRLQMGLDTGKNITQKDMADILGLERSQYSRYEKQIIQPSLDMALQIARTLNKAVEDIFYLE